MNETLLQNLDQLPEAMIRQGLDPERHAELLVQVRDFFRRYADLERRLLGEVWVMYPAHLLEALPAEDALKAGEELARRERARLHLGDGESGDLMTLLDREGLKVYRPLFPDDTPLEGIFLFDAEVGPSLIVNGRLAPLEADFVFSRLYAHYLIDNDPYSIHLLVRGGEPSVADLRAQSFAAAFLIPAEGLATYLKALNWTPDSVVDAGTATQLAAYFEVGYRTLFARLLSLNLIRADEVSPLLIVLESAGGPAVAERPENAIPERFVRLALEAHARKLFDVHVLALYLETDLAATRRLAGRFQLGDETSGREERPRLPRGPAQKGRSKP
jgi:Zn-dependent peptidase ImmA (M78 family)